MTNNTSSSFLKRPGTRLGWWAFGLAAVFVTMFILNGLFMSFAGNAPWRQTVLPFYGILMMFCALAAGVVGLIAIILNHERSWLVWLTILPGAFALLFILGEFLFPH